MLNVYKASAGSGKTFQLVLEYLKLILENPFNYKHILAVTFTNKATNEMKSRILEQLYKLANNEKSDYVKALQNEVAYSEQYIRQRAGEVLKNILHDYNRFSINTIDSFTQKVIKSFNRELGISPNFTLDIDNDMILEEAIDRMFSKIGNDKKLLSWLQDYSRERIEENRSQRLDTEIQKLGNELFKERFQVFFPENGESVYTRENLNELVKELRKITGSFETTLKNSSAEALELIDANGFSIEDFAYGKSGIGGFFLHFSEGNFFDSQGKYRLEGSRVQGCRNDKTNWYGKKHPRLEEISSLVEIMLYEKLEEIFVFSELNFARYNSALAVLKQVRTLGILIDLKEEIRELLHEKDILPLSDSNLLLSKIIGESDSPFVYEKMGTYYKHFMLDEFQDTSGLQWKNFRPLVQNSLAEGQNNLIVGDVKQSIYRWRNSDWNILAEQLGKDFSVEQRKELSLEYNWRSDQNIIDFNNEMFGILLGAFEDELFSELDDKERYTDKFRNIYDSYRQEAGKKTAVSEGYVTVDYFEKDDFTDESTRHLIEQVKTLQDQGLKASEIAILIRKNKEGIDIIEAFLEAARQPENEKYELSVLSNESLFLHASRGVLFIINMIGHLVDPGNQIIKANLLFLWLNWLKPSDQSAKAGNRESFYSNLDESFQAELSERLERAKEKVLLASLDEAVIYIASLFGIFEIASELPFVQALADKAGELKSSLSNDLSNFLFWWNEKGVNTSVSVNEEVESIRLLTVHKAKGLEYKAILIPYFNWDTSWSGFNTPLLWCEHPDAPFNRFPRLPVMADSTMKISEFSGDYFEEKVSSFIDTMNLVYVAFTRAKSVLMINSPLPKINKNGSESGKGTDKLLLLALRQLAGKPKFTGTFNETDSTFRFGNLVVSQSERNPGNTHYLNKYEFNDFSRRVSLRMSGEEFLAEGERHQSERNIGKLIHEILSSIETKKDLAASCQQALIDGKINKEERQRIETELAANLELEATKKWFDGSYQILNERDVLTKDRMLRPDRIMYSGDRAIVVDYKTGEPIPTKYNRQIESYARGLKESGFAKVEGFLWYLSSNEVVKVCEL